ncbi:MAG TPA: alpha/beta hydrolase [Acidimicrobiia bacterium]|jgi:acetyl esterase
MKVPLTQQAQTVLDMMTSLGFGGLALDADPLEIRALYDGAIVPSSIAIEYVEDRAVPGPAGDIPVRIYRPAGTSPQPVLVYFHGGGWVLGGLETHDGTCRRFADDAGCIVVSVDYRLAPETRFPGAVDDCYAATCWVAEHAAEIGADPARVAIGGDSAGGNLTAVVAQLARDRGGPALVFQLMIYPVTDCEYASRSMVDNAEGYFLTADGMRWFYGLYLSDPDEEADPRVSPLRAADLSNLPPGFVLTAEFDPLRDQGRAYAAALRAAGNEVPDTLYEGVFHGFFAMYDLIDVGKQAMLDAVAALRGAFEER